MDVQNVFAFLRMLEGEPPPITIVGCEPETTEPGMGLSAAVTRSVAPAAALVRRLLDRAARGARAPSHRRYAMKKTLIRSGFAVAAAWWAARQLSSMLKDVSRYNAMRAMSGDGAARAAGDVREALLPDPHLDQADQRAALRRGRQSARAWCSSSPACRRTSPATSR